jgi:hypothetical protein
VLESDRARVMTRVQIPDAPPFVQRFVLERAGPGAPWRVRSLVQSRVGPANALAAFVAAPDERRRLELWRSLGRGPT